MKSICHRTSRLVPCIVALGLVCAGTLQAQDVATMTKEQRGELIKASVEIEMLDRALALCQAMAPDYAAANQAIMDAYLARHSIDKIRPLGDQLISRAAAQNAEVEEKYTAMIEQAWEKTRQNVLEDPDQCRDGFAKELDDANLPNIVAVVDGFGLDTASDQALIGAADPAATSTAANLDPAEEAVRQKQLRLAHVEIQLVDSILATCKELAPDYATANQAIMDAFAVRLALGEIRPMAAKLMQDQPELEPDIAVVVRQVEQAFGGKPELCRDAFENTLNRMELPNIARVAQSLGLDTASGDAAAGSDIGLSDLTSTLAISNMMSVTW